METSEDRRDSLGLVLLLPRPIYTMGAFAFMALDEFMFYRPRIFDLAV
jgi:hypothetical protein